MLPLATAPVGPTRAFGELIRATGSIVGAWTPNPPDPGGAGGVDAEPAGPWWAGGMDAEPAGPWWGRRLRGRGGLGEQAEWARPG